jgi:3-oxoacyl-[acyl-carrier-protein] synthase-3
MVTDSVAVLRDGIELGRQTWADLHAELPDWQGSVDRVVGHQVGGPHREAMLRAFRLGPDQDFSIFEHLGNMGSAALPSAVGLAQDRGFLQPGRKVALLGIGSGLNCLMLGVRW